MIYAINPFTGFLFLRENGWKIFHRGEWKPWGNKFIEPFDLHPIVELGELYEIVEIDLSTQRDVFLNAVQRHIQENVFKFVLLDELERITSQVLTGTEKNGLMSFIHKKNGEFRNSSNASE